MEKPDSRNLNRSSGFVDLQPSMFEEPLTGPGDYTIPSFIPEGPMYSFPKAERFMTPLTRHSAYYTTLTPEKYAQVSYQQNRSNSAPVTSFRNLELKEFLNVPGPGSYDLKSTLFDRQITLKGKYPNLIDNRVPGPGSYEIQNKPVLKFPVMKDERMKNRRAETADVPLVYCELKSSTPSYSFRGRPLEKEPLVLPGPGAYQVKSTLYNNNFSIVGKTAGPADFKTPGPGAYNISPVKSAPSFSISMPLNSPVKNITPGPGEYSPYTGFSGPKYTMGHRYHSASEYDNRDFANFPSTLYDRSMLLRGKPSYPISNNNPGPGSYSPKHQKCFSGYSYGKSERMVEIELTPGPGEYNPDFKSSGPCYSMIGRGSENRFEVTPGPGAYNLPEESSRSTFLRGKPKELPDNNVPGPGKYSPDKAFKSVSYSLSRSNRFCDIEQTPGPGDFHWEGKKEGPKYSFTGRPVEFFKEQQSPGPGSYDIKGTRTNLSFSLRGKYKDLPDNRVPGPGSYEVGSNLSSIGFTLGNSGRTDFTKNNKFNPAPGQYEQPRSKSVEFSFSRARRYESPICPSPGPGAYDPKYMNNSKSPSLSGKFKEITPSKVPGPGAYNTKDLSKSPSYTFGQKASVNFDNQVPGPGSYSHLRNESSPSWTMSGRPVEKRLNEVSPGPCSYTPQPSYKSLAFTLTGKKDSKIEKTPGPGDYEVQQYKTQGFSFGHKRESLESDTPGPGTYHPRPKSSNPSWTMGGRPKSSIRQDKSPGPGQYEIPSTNNRKACTISKVGRKFSSSVTPGPGQYNQKSKMVESNGFSLGKGKRVDFAKIKTETPGPAAYDILGENGNFRGEFSKASRMPKYMPDTSGPLYKIDLKPDGPHYSLQGKWTDGNQNSTPGPGAYDQHMNNKKKMPAYTMGYKRDIISKLSRQVRKNFTPIRASKNSK